jgi:hypothetical protein
LASFRHRAWLRSVIELGFVPSSSLASFRHRAWLRSVIELGFVAGGRIPGPRSFLIKTGFHFEKDEGRDWPFARTLLRLGGDSTDVDIIDGFSLA